MGYISDLKIVYGSKPDNVIYGINNTALDVNRGQDGESAFIACETTEDPAKAIYGVDVVVQDWVDPAYNSYTRNGGHKFNHYLKPIRSPRKGSENRITHVGLARHIKIPFANYFVNVTDVWTNLKNSFGVVNDPRANVWKWGTAKHSANLNYYRGGDDLSIFMQYEGQMDDPPDEDNTQPLPAALWLAPYRKRNADGGEANEPQFLAKKELRPGHVFPGEEQTDYRDRLTFANSYSSVSRWFSKVRKGKVTEETKRQWKMLDERYQEMRGRAREGDPVPWDCEKHVRDAVADGW